MTTDQNPDFDGCNSECRKAGKHSLRWGGCEQATPPEPTVSMSVVYTDHDGGPSIGFDTYTVPELARLIEPVLGDPLKAAAAARRIVHRHDEQQAAVPSAAAPPTQADVLRWAAEQLLASDLGPRPGHTEDYGCGWSDATLRAQSYLLGLAQDADGSRLAEAPQPLPSIHANDVQGFCPACGHPTLYVGAGGHLVCSLMDCPKPEAADELLHVGAEAPQPETQAETRCICGHSERQHFEDVCITEITGCDCGDFLPTDAAAEEITRLQQIVRQQSTNGIADLPARLEAVLTERFTELGNPFSGMRRHEQGPDGWPASHPVGPNKVAEVLRELLTAAPAVVAQPGKEADRG